MQHDYNCDCICCLSYVPNCTGSAKLTNKVSVLFKWKALPAHAAHLECYPRLWTNVGWHDLFSLIIVVVVEHKSTIKKALLYEPSLPKANC